jgi:hypothetical protein
MAFLLNALRGSILVSSFKGRTAALPGYVVYRPSTKQLVVAISGTSTLQQAYHDIRTLKHRHPSKRGHVHSGFWGLYKGVKPLVFDAVRKGLEEHDVAELCITGHSMGGSLAYLLSMDLITPNNTHRVPLSTRLRLKVVVFGAPRTGSPGLVTYWQQLVKAHRDSYGQHAFMEYSVKAYNDGQSRLFFRYRGRLMWCNLKEYLRYPPQDSAFDISPGTHYILLWVEHIKCPRLNQSTRCLRSRRR